MNTPTDPRQQQTRTASPSNGAAPFSIQRVEQPSLAKFDPGDLMPRSWAEARELATFLSRAGMLPDHLKGNEHNTFLTILSGLELGISPLVACREIYFVKGKPNISSRLKVAMVRSSGLCQDYEEVEVNVKRNSNGQITEGKAVVRGRRVGQERWTVKEFTIEDARAGDLFKNDVWNKYPKDMLLARANSRLCDDLWQDVTRGMRSREEVEDERVIEGQRISPPEDPSRFHQPENGDVVDGETGEVFQEKKEDPLTFEALRRALDEAPNRNALQEATANVNKAKPQGYLTTEQLEQLMASYKSRLAFFDKNGNGSH